MGNGNSRRQKVLEPYTSFDVLPTEYFNRRALQQQYSQPVQAQIAQLPAPQAYYAQMPVQQQPQYFAAQQALAVPRYPQQVQPSPLFAPQPQAVYNQSQVFANRPMGYMGQPSQQAQQSLQRRQFGASSPQQIQSVPKFNQPNLKF